MIHKHPWQHTPAKTRVLGSKETRLGRLLSWTLVLATAPTLLFGMCIDEPGLRAPLDRSWIKIDQPIYWEYFGDLYQTAFNSNRIIALRRRSTRSIYEPMFSSDARYLTFSEYFGTLGIDYYIYDLAHQQKARLPVHVHVPQGLEFSPDSKRLAWLEIDVKENLQQLIIMNAQTRMLKRAVLPLDMKTLLTYRWAFFTWSPDGNVVYMQIYATPDVFYKYDLATGAFAKLDELPHDSYATQYLEDGHPHTAVNGNIALVDEHRLIVKTTDGKQTIVDNGGEGTCRNVDILINAWLQNGKYLLYRVDRIGYIYGVDEQKKAILLPPPFQKSEFVWAPESVAVHAIEPLAETSPH